MINSIWKHKKQDFLAKIVKVTEDTVIFELVTPWRDSPVGTQWDFLKPEPGRTILDVSKYFIRQYKDEKKASELLEKGFKIYKEYFGMGAYIEMVDGKIVNHNGMNWGPNSKSNYSLNGEWYIYERKD